MQKESYDPWPGEGTSFVSSGLLDESSSVSHVTNFGRLLQAAYEQEEVKCA